MEIESATDRSQFFDVVDFAVNCAISGPGYSKVLPVILNAISDQVPLYDTNVEAPRPHFICRAEELADFPRHLIKQFSAVIEGVTYKLERVTDDQDGLILTVYLKK